VRYVVAGGREIAADTDLTRTRPRSTEGAQILAPVIESHDVLVAGVIHEDVPARVGVDAAQAIEGLRAALQNELLDELDAFTPRFDRHGVVLDDRRALGYRRGLLVRSADERIGRIRIEPRA
jgi:hypothetical protein